MSDSRETSASLEKIHDDSTSALKTLVKSNGTGQFMLARHAIGSEKGADHLVLQIQRRGSVSNNKARALVREVFGEEARYTEGMFGAVEIERSGAVALIMEGQIGNLFRETRKAEFLTSLFKDTVGFRSCGLESKDLIHFYESREAFVESGVGGEVGSDSLSDRGEDLRQQLGELREALKEARQLMTELVSEAEGLGKPAADAVKSTFKEWCDPLIEAIKDDDVEGAAREAGAVLEHFLGDPRGRVVDRILGRFDRSPVVALRKVLPRHPSNDNL